MNAASIAVVAAIAVLFVLAVRRVLKRGAPCECGCDHKSCSSKGGKGCTCGCCH